jgi:hypothetical protein
MQGSRIARRGLQGAFGTGRPREAVGIGADADRSGAVIARVVHDLARTWTKQRRKRGPKLTTPASAVLQPTLELSRQQSARSAELPEDYRVVGMDDRTPLVRKLSGQSMSIQQNRRLFVATIAATRRLVATASPASD